jgi:ribonucleoside-diphosphate reductase alpha chain
MQVVKRSGERNDVSFDKVLQRVRKSSRGLTVNPDILAQQVLARIVDGIKTSELDELAAQMAASLCTTHPDWGTLASRIAISNHHKNTLGSFSEVVKKLSQQIIPKTGESISYLSEELLTLMSGPEAKRIDEYIKYERDYEFDYFGFKTLEKSYLLKDSYMRVMERPQHMWMRVALCLWAHDLPKAFETYDLLSQKFFTHATPTLFNAGTPRPQLSSCYLLAMHEDSIAGIYKTLGDCAAISKYAGGIGLHVHNVRARGALIRGTNGTSNGLIPMLRVFNNTARYVDQGGGRRNGSFAVYLEPWHADVEDFLKLKLNSGSEEERARDLFYALWISDLFMRRVETDSEWSLFCPSEAPGLADVHGEAFEKLYEGYEAAGRARRKVSARKLWFQILDTQMETGTPYLLYKDAANKKSNQQNLGTIKSSNLCTEIMEYSSPDETAVCNLASLALPMFVKSRPAFADVYDFPHLRSVVRTAVRNLNRVIDINFYPTPETRKSNMRHRPIGLGVQGLADVFAMLRLSWDSADAAQLNQRIFEHIYYAAVEESAALAVVEGPYETFVGSPASEGRLQPDLWGVTPLTEADKSLDWDALRSKAKAGLRNSLLVAPMPTASTSQILGYNECFEPFTTNIYTRRTLAGEFIVVNKYLTRELMDLGIWTDGMKQAIVARNGSIQGIPSIPEEIQARYKTSWELSQQVMIDMAAARGAFICQSQSLNLFVADPTYAKLTSMHFYAWKKGLKTGCYYLRTKAPVAAQKFTVDPRLMAALEHQSTMTTVPSLPDESYDTDTESDTDEEEAKVPTKEEKEAALEAKARAAAEKRAKMRESGTEYDCSDEVCISCGS